MATEDRKNWSLAVTPRVTVSLITFIKVVIKNQIHLVIRFYVAKDKIQIKFLKQVKKFPNFETPNFFP
jgi:hypothetical protein